MRWLGEKFKTPVEEKDLSAPTITREKRCFSAGIGTYLLRDFKLLNTMASSIRRRFSYNSSGDKEFRKTYVSRSRKLSVDSCLTQQQHQHQQHQHNRHQESSGITARINEECVSVKVVSPRIKISESPDERKCSIGKTLPEQAKSDVKPILKKQGSESYNYAGLLSLVCPASSSRESISRGTDASSSTVSSSLSSTYPANGRQLRRVRFSESVSLIDDDYSGEGVRKVLGEISSDVNLVDNTKTLPLSEMGRDNDSGGHMTSMNSTTMNRGRSVQIQSGKYKEDSKAGPLPKRSKLSSANFALSKHLTNTKSAWGRMCVSSSCDDISILKDRTNKKVKSSNRSLERSKTTLGTVDYSSIKSKLRRMGFFDSGRKINSSRPVSVNGNESSDKSVSDQPQRPTHNYSTFREELYTIGDYHDNEDNLSMKFISSAFPPNACLRSLGDEYARFLKGRYSVDDVSCS